LRDMFYTENSSNGTAARYYRRDVTSTNWTRAR
jgi:hypothetical protein